MLSPIPGAVALKPGSCTKPVPGIIIDVIDENGDSVELGGNGYLVIKKPFPSQVRTIWNDKHDSYIVIIHQILLMGILCNWRFCSIGFGWLFLDTR